MKSVYRMRYMDKQDRRQGINVVAHSFKSALHLADEYFEKLYGSGVMTYWATISEEDVLIEDVPDASETGLGDELIRWAADNDHWLSDGDDDFCRFCGGSAVYVGALKLEDCHWDVLHTPDCLHLRAKALVERSGAAKGE